MNLMKFFNLKFLKENIKKSNGVLLFLVFIIPVFNIITIFNVYKIIREVIILLLIIQNIKKLV